MKALMFIAPGVVALREVPEPALGSGDVLVHVTAAGICGSELHGVRTPGFRQPPLVLGHECAGVTSEGARVVVHPIVSCGRCELCGRGLRHLCRDRKIVGVHRPGALAERVGVARSAIREIPGAMSWHAAAVVEPAANAVHAWALVGRPAGARVGIIGAGAIGLLCALVAAGEGAAQVEVADISPVRRAVAATLELTVVGAELRDEYDVIFDAVGSAATRRASLARLRPGGAAVWLGLLEAGTELDAAELVRTEKRVLGSFAYTDEEFAEAIRLATGWEPGWLESWVEGFPLQDGAEVFTALMNGRARPVKALLCPE